MHWFLPQARGCIVMHSGIEILLAQCWGGCCRSQPSNRCVRQQFGFSRPMLKIRSGTQPAALVLDTAQADDSSNLDMATAYCKSAGPQLYCTSNQGCHHPQWCSSRPPGHWKASDNLHPSGWQTLDEPTCSHTDNCLPAGAQAPLWHELHYEVAA